jgi:hypothetical protein
LKRKLLERLIARLGRRLQAAGSLSERFVRLRMIVVGAGLGGTFLLYQAGQGALADGFFALFALAFGILAYFHSKLKRRTALLSAWIGIKRTHLARLDLSWSAIPPAREYHVPAQHPYARDLDIVGEHSVLRLIDSTFSTDGRKGLASALLSPELDGTILKKRQRLIQEIVPRSLLRDRLVLEAKTSSSGEIRGEEILAALRASEAPAGLGAVLAIEATLAGLTALFFALEYGLGWPRFWAYTFLAYVSVYFFYSGRLGLVFGRALALRAQLDRLGRVLSFLEGRKEAKAPELAGLTAPFRQAGARPSATVGKVARVCAALSVKGNPLAHLILNAFAPWDLFFSYRYEKIRQEVAGTAPVWLEALGRLDSASSLAGFAWFHPSYPFPEILDGPEKPGIEASALGHPLIASTRRVSNDFRLSGSGSVALLTGSNMSGKSTFLRTVGVNVCLAQAGGPVCARSFSTSLFRIGCSVRIDDDLEEGLSYFYAEVKRLKEILEATKTGSPPPVLFLIDEIFKGTNNRERIIGSASYLKTLVQGNGLGLVSTHDLELAALSTESPKIANFHFQESISNGRLVFDYRLRPGPCPTTNALRIMAMEGLPVPEGNV